MKDQKIDSEKVAVEKDVKVKLSAEDEIMQEEKAKQVKKNQPMEVTELDEEGSAFLSTRGQHQHHKRRGK